jgi:4-hydroxy-2-oxoheptanedioate aldolase
MPTIRNIAREKLEQGALSLGCGVRLTRSVEISVAMKSAGFDWLFLDLEHGTMSIDAAAQIATAALDAGIAPLARVPNGEYAIATRLLDNGVMGIVMPHVDTADEAREVVQKLNIRRSVTAPWAAPGRTTACARQVPATPPAH